MANTVANSDLLFSPANIAAIGRDGEFFLADLAGSEGSQVSKDQSIERLAETKDINTSLPVLKDCIRGRTLWGLQQMGPSTATKKVIHIPCRSSKLTQVLKHIFATQNEQACKTLVIASVAPSIVDSVHSKNTLRFAEILKVPIPKSKNQRDPLDPRWWSNTRTKELISGNSGSHPIDGDILVADLNGIALCKLK